MYKIIFKIYFARKFPQIIKFFFNFKKFIDVSYELKKNLFMYFLKFSQNSLIIFTNLKKNQNLFTRTYTNFTQKIPGF